MEVDNLVNLDNELSSLTKEQLIDKIKSLQEEVEQLQRKRPLEESEQPKRLTKKQRQGKGEKVFVFDRW
jgi:formate-dependent phosphoribosylglycinamide formyltransferase (GAR transformylase)